MIADHLRKTDDSHDLRQTNTSKLGSADYRNLDSPAQGKIMNMKLQLVRGMLALAMFASVGGWAMTHRVPSVKQSATLSQKTGVASNQHTVKINLALDARDTNAIAITAR